MPSIFRDGNLSCGYGGQGRLDDAIALNSSMFNGARGGPAVAGILVARIAKAGLLRNAVSYIAVILVCC